MYDYKYEDEDGKEFPISSLSTELINELLDDGFSVDSDYASEESIRDRLQLELFIRSLGWSSSI